MCCGQMAYDNWNGRVKKNNNPVSRLLEAWEFQPSNLDLLGGRSSRLGVEGVGGGGWRDYGIEERKLSHAALILSPAIRLNNNKWVNGDGW